VIDVDTIFGHGAGITEEERDRIKSAVEPIPYVELRASTGGSGLHIYVWVAAPVPTFVPNDPQQSRRNHAALGRHVLGLIARDAQLDFPLAEKVDCVGRNTWFAARRALDRGGFRCLKPHVVKLSAQDVQGWEQHLEVFRTRKRVSTGLGDDATRLRRIPEDGTHKAILAEVPHSYVPDEGCYHVHTCDLRSVHEKLNLKGGFETVSPGRDSKPNAFMFPADDGSFVVLRFGDAQEHPLWAKSKGGNQYFRFNAPLEMRAVARAVGAGFADSAFTCNPEQALNAAKYLGIVLPEIDSRPITFRLKKTDLTLTVQHGKGDKVLPGWNLGYRCLKVSYEIEKPSGVATNHDDKYRAIVRDGKAAGFQYKVQGKWIDSDASQLDAVLAKDGYGKDERLAVRGALQQEPFTTVQIPFQPEYLPGRRLNTGQRLIEASQEPGEHPTYDLVVSHVGRNLDKPVAMNSWCQQHGIRTGAEFLLCWLAYMIRDPGRQLPILVFYSSQSGHGKTKFHESIGLLFEPEGDFPYGLARDIVLCLKEKFNSALKGCVLGVIDDESIDAHVYEKLKRLIGSQALTLRGMFREGVASQNYLHIVFCMNTLSSYPMDKQDGRTVVLHVGMPAKQLSWERELRPKLLKESPAFLRTLLDLSVPDSDLRFVLPIISTTYRNLLSSDLEGTYLELAGRLVELWEELGTWNGTVSDLVPLLKAGAWGPHPPAIGGYLAEVVPVLQSIGVPIEYHAAANGRQATLRIGQDNDF
jgi:hypothetical protein